MNAKIDGDLPKLLRDHVGGHWQHIETGSTAGGVPDDNYCVEGVEGWVESKQTHGWTVKFRTGQVAWLMRRSTAGGRCFVAIRRWPAPADELWIVPGLLADALAQYGMRHVQVGSLVLCGGPRQWNWDAVRRRLIV
jgi:hypothetical protein